MAKLKSTFIKGINTIFNIFEEAVKIGKYSSIQDDGFGTPAVTEYETVRCIFETFTAKDLQVLSFGPLIQPKDIKGLVPYEDLSIELSMQDTFTFDGVIYTVEAWEIDPMVVLYTLLLRRT